MSFIKLLCNHQRMIPWVNSKVSRNHDNSLYQFARNFTLRQKVPFPLVIVLTIAKKAAYPKTEKCLKLITDKGSVSTKLPRHHSVKWGNNEERLQLPYFGALALKMLVVLAYWWVFGNVRKSGHLSAEMNDTWLGDRTCGKIRCQLARVIFSQNIHNFYYYINYSQSI